MRYSKLDKSETRFLCIYIIPWYHKIVISETRFLRTSLWVEPLYYQQIQQPENDPLAILKQSDFIGCGESDRHLSSTYKAKLKTILNN